MIERTHIFLHNVKSYVAAGITISLLGILGECTATYGSEFLHYVHNFL
jgi:hypothetical protein